MPCDDLLARARELVRRGCDFVSLSANCHGAYPLAIRDALNALIDESECGAQAERVLISASRVAIARPRWDSRLPLPHPDDADWRFAQSSAAQLLQTVINRIAPNDSILLLACPTLALLAADVGLSKRIIYCAKVDDPVTVAVRAAVGQPFKFVDIAEDLEHVRAGAAILDPPWYDDVAQPFIAKAASAVSAGGLVAVCGPDSLTGANAASKLASLNEYGRELGLSKRDPQTLRVRYETPFFEACALGANEITNFHPRWRTGQVNFFRSIGGSSAVAVPEIVGVERRVGHTRFRLRHRASAKPEFGPLLSCSVSRRDPLRDRANIWSSGNRAATIATETWEFSETEAKLDSWAAAEWAEVQSRLQILGPAGGATRVLPTHQGYI